MMTITSTTTTTDTDFLQLLTAGLPAALDLATATGSTGPDLYLVGGSVRDLLLRRPLADLDFSCRAQDIAAWETFMLRHFSGRFITLGQGDRTTRRLVAGDFTVDITPLEGPDIITDLGRRDFTVNAMAWDFRAGRLIDPHHGREALAGHRIIAVSPRSLHEDPVRILRAARFALELDAVIDIPTREQMRAAAPGLPTAPGERRGHELRTILTRRDGARGINLLAENGAIFHLFPALRPLAGLAQGNYHHLDAWEHTLSLLAHLDPLLTDNPFQLPPPDAEGQLALHLAGLLHDTGKAQTRTVDPETGAVHFYGHERFSAHLAAAVMKPLALGRRIRTQVIELIEHHLEVLLLARAPAKAKTFRKLVFRIGEPLPLLLLLTLADSEATRGRRHPERHQAVIRCGRELLEIYRAERQALITPLISGQDLIALGLPPGPRFGEIIHAVREHQLEGEIEDRKTALAWVRRTITTE
ncbi:MAG: CCA tRNA nucleotidyltransferase [Deltaproteobacteria bacterium]|nr:CCA tRNA nucleotidyltransferase [Candidatus Anaeroferrophillacea bacterium]